MDGGAIIGLLVVFGLVAANGFFVAGEFALVKIRRTRIDQLAEEGSGSAKVVQRELDHLDNYIAATQLGITLASLALGWAGEPAVARLIEPLFDLFLPRDIAEGIGHTVAIIISFSIITLFHIVIGELVPKSIALQRTESTALLIARPLSIFNRVFRPVIMLMNGVGNGVVRLLGLNTGGEHTSVHSVEELEMLVSQSREAGLLDRQEEVLLRRVFDFGDKTVNQVMMPRTEIIGIPKDITFDELVDMAAEEHYTRLPLYDGTLDNIIGVVHVKDLFALLRKSYRDQEHANFKVTQIMRPVLKVPETLPIEDLLTQMRQRRVHLTVIIDEYGGTAGIVTLEDILEEIVGEVADEFDTVEEGNRPEVEVLPDGTSSINGLMTLDEFAERFGVTLADSDYETIAGYVFGEIGRTPGVGDEVAIDRYVLRVEEMDNLRIARLRVINTRKDEENLDEPEQTPVSSAAHSN